MPIARTVMDAQVGDQLWFYENRWRPCSWKIVSVLKVARLYLTAGDPKHPGAADRFDRETGWEKAGNYAPHARVWGHEDRRRDAWMTLGDEMADQIKLCTDVGVLKEVAFALGEPEPPLFTDLPPETTEGDQG